MPDAKGAMSSTLDSTEAHRILSQKSSRSSSCFFANVKKPFVLFLASGGLASYNSPMMVISWPVCFLSWNCVH